jgi:capsular exopolysaccharide synthesis family protein
VESIDVQAGDSEDHAPEFDFARYLYGIRRYAWLLITLVVLSIGGAVVYTSRLTPIYEAVASIQVEPRLPDVLGTGDLFGLAGGLNSAEYYREQKKILDSYMLCKQTVEQNDLVAKLLTATERKSMSQVDQVDMATRRLQKIIDVRYPDLDRIFYVVARNADKHLAADLANQHVQTYYNYARGLLTLDSSAASSELMAEFKDAEAKLRDAEQKIYKFEAENDMIAVTLEERQNLVTQNILAFTQKINDQTATEIGLNAKLNEMRRESDKDVLSTPVVMMGDNPSYEALRTQYYAERTHLIELEKDLGPKNSDYIAQKQKVDELYKALKGEVDILVDGTKDLYAAATATNSGLKAELDKYKEEAKALSPKIVIYNDLKRQQKDYEDQYNILRARLQTTQMTGNMSSILSNVRPLDPALLPTGRAWPNMKINVAIAGVLALMLGIGIVFLIVFFDRSIKAPSDVVDAAGTPVLGIIPVLGSDELLKDDDRSRDMYVHENPTSRVAECCRSLRTNIMFSAADRKFKTIVVCSANPREGKTTTVIYLGTTMAQSGQRVLLIDTDMRRPRLHASLAVPREPGLSNLLLGDDNYDELTKPTEVPNLFVLPCGPLPPNPAELVMTKRFEIVLEELSRRFDRIILDSPPINAVTDAVVLSRRADGIIFVARAGKTLRDDLKRSASQVRDVGGAIFGVIVNEFKNSERGSYYYYSYYGTYGTSADGKKTAA